MTITTHHQVISERLELEGVTAVDVGCGAGELVRFLRSQGAHPIGLECNDATRVEAIAADPDHAADYLDAIGQVLPFDDASVDLVVYSYSLHHVPIDDIPAALVEARRVLRDGGVLYSIEPSTDDVATQLSRPIEDETVARLAAQAALTAATGFDVAHRFDYLTERVYADFDEWADSVVGNYDDRVAPMAEHREHLHDEFYRRATRRDDGWVLQRVTHAAILIAR